MPEREALRHFPGCDQVGKGGTHVLPWLVPSGKGGTYVLPQLVPKGEGRHSCASLLKTKIEREALMCFPVQRSSVDDEQEGQDGRGGTDVLPCTKKQR
jgi:hypothetical protein